MIVKYKNGGGSYQVPFNPELAARLIKLGHQIDFDPNTSPERQQQETDAVQKYYDYLEDCDRRKGWILPKK